MQVPWNNNFRKLSIWISRYISSKHISVLLNGHTFSFHLLNVGVPHRTVLAPTPLLLNNLLSTTTNYPQLCRRHSTWCYLSVSNLLSSLVKDLEKVLVWSAESTYSLTNLKLSRVIAHRVVMNKFILDNKKTFERKYLAEFATSAVKQLGFFFPSRAYPAFSNLNTPCVSQITLDNI